MTTYRQWVASFAQNYADVLARLQQPVGLFLYDTSHTLIEALIQPIRPLLLEKNMQVEVVSWEQIIELEKICEPLRDDPESLRYDAGLAKAVRQAYDELQRLSSGEHLLIVTNFCPPSKTSNDEERYYREGAAQWLLFIADARLKRIEEQWSTDFRQLLWVLSPYSRNEWVEALDDDLKFHDYLLYRLWYSSIVNGKALPVRGIEETTVGPSQLLKGKQYPPIEDLTPIERKLRDTLDIANVEYSMQYPVSGYRLDFAIIRDDLKLDVECDGQAFHSSQDQVERDRQRNNTLTEQGWIVLRYSGSQIHRDPFSCVGQILRTLMSHGANITTFPQDETGAYIPPTSNDTAEEINVIVKQKLLEDELRKRAEFEAERQAVLDNPEYARNRERINAAIRELAQTLAIPPSKRITS